MGIIIIKALEVVKEDANFHYLGHSSENIGIRQYTVAPD
jgi:hypothetical protein